MNKFVLLCILLFVFGKLYGQNINENKELSMDEAIEIALKNHPEVNSAQNKINASTGRFWSGISLPSPEASLSYDFIPSNNSMSNYSEKTIGISQSMEFPYYYFLKGSKLSKEKEIAENELKLVSLGIILKVKTAYFSLLMQQEQLKLANENCALTEDFYKKAEVRYKVGDGTNLELLTAKVQYSEAINNIETQKNHLVTAAANFNYALGSNDSKTYKLIERLEFSPLKLIPGKIIAEADADNAQIKISELRVGSFAYDNKLAWISLLPKISLAYFKQTKDGVNDYYGTSFGISIPLWFMFDHRGKIEEATANLDAAESDLQLEKNATRLKIKSSIIELTEEENQVKFYQDEILPQAEEIYRTASKSYDAGEISYLEFLQAKQILISSKRNYINYLLNYNLSVIKLEEAAGKRLK